MVVGSFTRFSPQSRRTAEASNPHPPQHQICFESPLSQGRPEIFNTDQGGQFTGDDFLDVLRDHGVAISMDGRERFSDNIFVERLWRSLKCEEVYLKAYRGIAEARRGLAAYFEFYDHERLHQALGYRAPRQVFEEIHGGC